MQDKDVLWRINDFPLIWVQLACRNTQRHSSSRVSVRRVGPLSYCSPDTGEFPAKVSWHRRQWPFCMCVYWNPGWDGVAAGKKSSPLWVRNQAKQTGWWTPKNQSDAEAQGCPPLPHWAPGAGGQCLSWAGHKHLYIAAQEGPQWNSFPFLFPTIHQMYSTEHNRLLWCKKY